MEILRVSSEILQGLHYHPISEILTSELVAFTFYSSHLIEILNIIDRIINSAKGFFMQNFFEVNKL